MHQLTDHHCERLSGVETATTSSISSSQVSQTSFLEATVHGNASFLWRSLCGSRDVLSMGLRWRVGNGRKIKVWHDKWLPTPSTFKVISSPCELADGATVDQLIERGTMRWKLDMLHRIFCPRDAEIIQKIPLSSRCPNDTLIWTASKNGVFSVRSAYHMLLSAANRDEPSVSSSRSLESQFWSSLWSVQVPPKVKLFIWKACKNIVPTQTKLFDKGLSSSFSCQWCLEEPETCSHILWGCEFAQNVWKRSSVPMSTRVDVRMNFREVVEVCLSGLQSPALEISFTTAWALWNARNETYWDSKVPNVDDICSRAAVLALDFLESGLKGESCRAPRVCRRDQMETPTAGSL